MPDYSETQGEPVKPLSAFYSTSLSPRVTSYDELATRIAYALGYPMVNIEAHVNAVYDNISVACEMYAKFAGYSEEYLVFDSDLYEYGKGIRLDKLFSITPDLSACYDTSKRELATECCPEETETVIITGYDVTCSVILTSSDTESITGTTTTCITATTGTESTGTTATTGTESTGTTATTGTESTGTTATTGTYITDELSNQIEILLINQLSEIATGTNFALTGTSLWDSTTGTETTGTTATTGTESTATSGEAALTGGTSVTCFTAITATPLTGTYTSCVTSITSEQPATTGTTTTPCSANTCQYNTGYDYDLNDYRKVIDVWSFNQGTHTGVNTLFTLEQSLAQQTYFSYAMGNYGFDLVSWYAVKEWLELREKLLCTRPNIHFNERTQYMQLIPAPRSRYWGLVACYVELPVKDLVKSQWVYKYALALTKMVVGRVRGKYAGTNLMGGGNIDGESLVSEGKEEREQLETQLYEGAPGLGDNSPPQFFVG